MSKLSDDLLFGIGLFVVATFLSIVFLTMAFGSENCVASIYGTHDRDQNGTITASGIRLNDAKPTMAHKSLPLRSYARVTNRKTGVSGVFQVTDRGPFVRGRCADLSLAAGHEIGISGLGSVTVDPVR